uniref:Uncharacterized protein n=1 Tax=Salvator merianae TaxID=96440 RepID=A0A8D0E3P2_SALMN
MKPAGLLLLLALWTDLRPVSSRFTNVCYTFPKESASCGEPKNRFFYNSTSRRCEPFVYRGCPQTLNRFHTVDECQRHCGQIEKPGSCLPSPKDVRTECLAECTHDGTCPGDKKCCSFGCALRCADAVQDICKLPPDEGPCDKKLRRWHYDWHTKQCNRFIFGGCLGNKNNFLKRKECLAQCGKQVPS